METSAAVARAGGARHMYEAYWGLSQSPFRNVPDPAFFCPLPAHQEALERLLYAVQYGKGGVVITGEAGCGKSTLSRVFLLKLDEEKYDVGLVINPSLPPDELLYEIALQLDLSPTSSQRVALFRSLNEHLLTNAEEGRATVLIIDEAHLIKDEAVFEDHIVRIGPPHERRKAVEAHPLPNPAAPVENFDHDHSLHENPFMYQRTRASAFSKLTPDARSAVSSPACGLPTTAPLKTMS